MIVEYTFTTKGMAGESISLTLSGSKLKPKVKKAWVAALRSGNYDQTENYLRVGNNYCCLGVLCDLGSGKWRKPTEMEFNSHCLPDTAKIYCPVGGFVGGPEKDIGTMPPTTVIEASGITKDDMSALTELNDTGCSFDEIADFIEEHF